jgi:hypothetical protein
MGNPYCLTVEKTSIAMASGDGRADRGTLHVTLSPVQSVHMPQLSMNRRNARSYPDIKTSRSSFSSFVLIFPDQL